jgi:hypothetical protein
MPFWAIGPIRGQYQPEDLTETQTADFESQHVIGGTFILTFKEWTPREVSLSFVVDGAANLLVDPEDVWQKILDIMRPRNGLFPIPILVNLPGWGGAGRNVPRKALITNASINRTHVQGQTANDLTRFRAAPEPQGGSRLTQEQVAAVARASGLSPEARREIEAGGIAGGVVTPVLGGESQPIRAIRATITVQLKEATIFIPG